MYLAECSDAVMVRFRCVLLANLLVPLCMSLLGCNCVCMIYSIHKNHCSMHEISLHRVQWWVVFSCFQRCSSNTRLDLCTFIGKIDANEFVSGSYSQLKSSTLSIIRDYRRIWEGFRQKLGLLGSLLCWAHLSHFHNLRQVSSIDKFRSYLHCE